jgi:hypothetical protein
MKCLPLIVYTNVTQADLWCLVVWCAADGVRLAVADELGEAKIRNLWADVQRIRATLNQAALVMIM